MLDMKELWNYLDNEISVTPMPKEYENFFVDILCKDCHEASLHIHLQLILI
jgi:RING finger and CHY zinc finger domain-containing protein 1